MSTTTTTASAENIALDHVGPIEHLSIPIPEGGGLVVLRGKNGTGKTHALESVESLYSKEARKSLRKQDGVPSGTIEGLGVRVRLGRTNTSKGELLCESLDGRVDPSQLVDPGIKDEVKADAKRLATLIRLAGVTISPESWCDMLGDAQRHIAVDDLVSADPVVVADRIRRRLHAVALQHEREATSKASEAGTLQKSVADVPQEGGDKEELSRQYEAASNAVAVAERARDNYMKAKESHDAAQEKISAMPVIDVQSLVESCALQCGEVEHITNSIATIEQNLVDLRARLESAKQEMAHRQQRLDDATSRADERAEMCAVIDAGLPETVTNDELDALMSARADAMAAVERGEVIRRAQLTRVEAEALERKAGELSEAAESLRALARSTDAALESALADAGFDKIKVHDGRLCVQSDRGLEPVSDLSHGERWRLALDIASTGLPAGAVLPVCQEAFESLDPDNRAFVSGLAKERGLVIITAEATGGELRAEIE